MNIFNLMFDLAVIILGIYLIKYGFMVENAETE